MRKRTEPGLAKLQAPRLYSPVRRQRLFDLLDDCSRHPAVWVSGPPGSGKTTLLASYLDERAVPTLWMQADQDDSDAPTFAYYLARALQAGRGKRHTLPVLAPEHLDDVRAFARKYFQQLFTKLGGDCAIVFDNMHELAEDSLVWPMLDVALSQVPLGTCMYFVSRAHPPAAMAPHLAKQLLREIAWPDLRFSDEEAERFVRSRARLDAAAMTSVLRQADGWVAGLVLMLGHAGLGRLPDPIDESRRRVFDYFASDLFERMSERQRDMLMRLAWLGEITQDIAVQVCGGDEVAALLEHLYRLQLFTDRRGGREFSYRFHDLFRDFLQDRCRLHHGQGQCVRIWRGVAGALESRALFDQAIPRYLDAGDYDAAARVVLHVAPHLVGQGRLQPLRAGVDALPAPVLAANPWLRYWLGVALMHTDLPSAAAILQAAHADFVRANDLLGRALSAAASINIVYFEYDRFERMGPWMAELDALGASGLTLDSPHDEIAVLGAVVQAALFQAPTHAHLLPAVARLRALLAAPVDVNHRMSAAIPLLIYASLIADYPLGDGLLDKVADLVADPRLTPLNQAYWWLFVGYYMHVRGEPAQAFAAFDRSDAIAADYGLAQTQVLSMTLRSYELQASGEVAAAIAILREVERRVDLERNMDKAQYHLSGTLLNLVTLDGAAAARHARAGMDAANQVGSPFFRAHWMWFCAAGLALNGEFDEAAEWLDTCWRESVGTYCERHLSGILVIRAYMALRRGDEAQAIAHIEAMLDHARRHDTWTFIRMTLGIKDPVLRFAFRRGLDGPYVTELIERLPVAPGIDAGEDWPYRLHVYTLGGFRLLHKGRQVQLGRREPRKPLQLLRAIVAMGGERVQLSALQDALWPDQEGDAAKAACEVALHRLRRLLGAADLLTQSGGTVSIDRTRVWVDAYALLDLPDDARARPTSSGFPGEFLPDDLHEPWTAPMRERIRRRQAPGQAPRP